MIKRSTLAVLVPGSAVFCLLASHALWWVLGHQLLLENTGKNLVGLMLLIGLLFGLGTVLCIASLVPLRFKSRANKPSWRDVGFSIVPPSVLFGTAVFEFFEKGIVSQQPIKLILMALGSFLLAFLIEWWISCRLIQYSRTEEPQRRDIAVGRMASGVCFFAIGGVIFVALRLITNLATDFHPLAGLTITAMLVLATLRLLCVRSVINALTA
jgi:hypothetical protein